LIYHLHTETYISPVNCSSFCCNYTLLNILFPKIGVPKIWRPTRLSMSLMPGAVYHQTAPAKTQLILLGMPQQLSKIDPLHSPNLELSTFHLFKISPGFGSSPRPGTYLHSTVDPNILCRNSYYQLRQLKVISRSLTPTTASNL